MGYAVLRCAFRPQLEHGRFFFFQFFFRFRVLLALIGKKESGCSHAGYDGRDWLSEPGRHMANPAPFGAFACVCLPYSHLSPASSRADSLLHPGRRRLLDPQFRLGAGSLGAWRKPFAESAGDEAVLAIKRARRSRLGLPPSLFTSPSAIALVRTPL